MNKENLKNNCCLVSRSSITKRDSINRETSFSSQSIRFKENLVYISGGEFLMGTNDKEGFSFDKEGPVRRRTVKPFYIDRTVVTNKEFSTFVEETSYVTDAEKYGWSFVFYKFLSKKQIKQTKVLPGTSWWRAVDKAFWYQPEGVGSSINNRLDHPVIHISWNDAKAFAQWANKRLPTEKEWEYAARGGLQQKKYPWGDELTPNDKHQCNIWQGEFPENNTLEDGYFGTAPAKSYPPNGYQLYNMSGNVWEWCADWFDKSVNTLKMVDPQAPKVIRGGSYLCHYSYCNRYRVAARSFNTMDSSSGNLGFRCAIDV